MIELKDRLTKHFEEYSTKVRTELIVQKECINKIKPILGNIPIEIETIIWSSYIYIKNISAEYFESEIISDLSDALGVKWSRVVDGTGISYYTHMDIKEIYIYITVITSSGDSCRIVPIETGEMIEVEETVRLKKPLIKYIISCND